MVLGGIGGWLSCLRAAAKISFILAGTHMYIPPSGFLSTFAFFGSSPGKKEIMSRFTAVEPNRFRWRCFMSRPALVNQLNPFPSVTFF